MALIWVLSSMSSVPSFDDVPFRDKGIHFMEYGVLAAFLVHALQGTWPGWARPGHYFAAALAAVVWGLSDEIHQAFVPGRSSDAKDVLADAIGAVLGAGVYLLGCAVLRRLRASAAQRVDH